VAQQLACYRWSGATAECAAGLEDKDLLINEQLTPQLQLMRQRVQTLYQQGGTLSQQNDMLAAAFEELELALEQLQIAEAHQRRKDEEWLNERAALEIESQSFQYLFDNAPAGYLVTSLDGTIRKANPIAAKLLECSERNLIGRSIALFVPEGQRREFRAQIAQLSEANRIQDKELTMQSWEHTSFEAGLTVAAIRGKTGGRPIALHWLMRDITDHKQALPALQERAVGGELSASTMPAEEHEPDNNRYNGEVESLARQRFTFLAKASVQLMLAQDLDAMFGHVAHLAVPELADACIIDLADPQSEKIQRLVVMHEPHTQDLVRTWRRSFSPEKRASASRAGPRQPPIAARQSDSVDVSKREELRSILGTLEPASAIVAALQCGERQIGSVTLISSKANRQYDSVDAALVEELARQMSYATARLHCS
jgi:PAS domain S-box-containing protein